MSAELSRSYKMPKTICLNMIVKNESPVIERCLSSIKKMIDTWVIVDTGSTDGTQEIIREIMKDIPGKLYERRWVNFGHNRNEALALARGKANYILFIDADDRLLIPPGFSFPELEKEIFHIFQRRYHPGRNEYGLHQVVFMIKDQPDFAWEGVLHEAVIWKGAKSYELLRGIEIEYMHDGARGKDPNTAMQDALLLEEALAEEPGNCRNMFYLAQSYRGCGRKEKAIEAYKKRASAGGSSHEVFHSLYLIGLLEQELKLPSETFIKSFCRAFLNRPSRIEPLWPVLVYYLETSNFFLAFLIAEAGLAIPCPDTAEVAVEPWIYQWGALWQYFYSCLQIGENEKAKAAIKKLPADKKEEAKKIYLSKIKTRLRCG